MAVALAGDGQDGARGVFRSGGVDRRTGWMISVGGTRDAVYCAKRGGAISPRPLEPAARWALVAGRSGLVFGCAAVLLRHHGEQRLGEAGVVGQVDTAG